MTYCMKTRTRTEVVTETVTTCVCDHCGKENEGDLRKRSPGWWMICEPAMPHDVVSGVGHICPDCVALVLPLMKGREP